jgi:protein ImuB
MKLHTAKRRQEAEADARRGARRARAQDGRASISPTADLFAETDASPASASAPPSPAPLTSTPASAPPRVQRPALRPLQAGGVPPTTQTAGRARPKQLWYAAVFPELISAEHSATVLQRLCLHAQRFTSFVSIELPNALLLEIKGSLKLFGPLERLHADLDDCWRRLALPAHSATAPSTLAALWLARDGRRDAGHPVVTEDLGTLSGHLAKLPIACTAWDLERLQTLRAMGVTCMGELLRLPRAGLARRLGPAAVQDLDIALARQFAPRRAFVPRERFRARCDFETEIENVAYLEKALEPLIARCAEFLRERQAGVQALRLKLRHRAGPATRVHLGLASITSERCRLRDVLVQKLGRLEIEAPVRGVELVSGSLQPLSAGSLDVFGGSTGTGSHDTAPQLVERLRARLGEDAVYGICSIPEHRPEAAWRRIHELRLTAVSKIGGRMTDEEAIDHGMPRPVWLLNEPLPLDEPLSLPEPLPLSKPAMRRQEAGADARRAPAGRGPGWPESMPQWHRSSVVLEQGPERIESGWWDGKGVARDYYVARQCGGRKPEPTPAGRPQGEGQDGPSQSYGARLWVFQERQSKRWYLHGVFA